MAMVVVLAPVFLPITNALGIHRSARRAVRGVLRNRVPDASFRREPVHHHEITDVKLEEVALKAFPYLCTIWLLIILFAACPQLVMFLPNLLIAPRGPRRRVCPSVAGGFPSCQPCGVFVMIFGR
ncbi:hypothetical protein [Bilophila wadsworthia]|uniref:hypothetical protein n=1 Tax=Bilophila wadsworthia TaxID=35833 RepID=UPI003990CB3F